jgi:hypothetical protein
MPFDGRTRCKLCGAEHRLNEPHRFPEEPAIRRVEPVARPVVTVVPAASPVVLTAMVRARRAYRARQKAQTGTTADRTNAERQRRYRARQSEVAR